MELTAAGRRRWSCLFVLVLAWSVLVPAAPSTADGSDPVIHSLTPIPGEIVAAGETILTARVSASGIDRHTVTVDGTVVASTLQDRDARDDLPIQATVSLPPGDHDVVVAIEDTGGRTARRAWTFTATGRTTARHAGATRLETAVAISAATYPEGVGASTAVLARADDFADALAGAPLAVAVDGPLLLTHSDALPDVTAAELARVLDDGAVVHLLGGRTAVSDDVADTVTDLGFRVRRHGGVDRYETAAALARLLPDATAAVLASGAAFPDALTASVPAARDGMPVLLTAPDGLPAATRAVLADGALSHVTIVGGTAAINQDVEDDVAARTESHERLAGTDRYATAISVLERFFDTPPSATLASGTAFPDALTGTRHAAANNAPLLLTETSALPPPTASTLARLQPDRIDIYGGPAAVSQYVARSALRRAVDGPGTRYAVGSAPPPLATVSHLDGVTVMLDRAVDPTTTTVYVAIGDQEMRGRVEGAEPTETLHFRFADGVPPPSLDVAHHGRVTVDGVVAGERLRDEIAFTYLRPDPVFATAGGVLLHLPSRDVEMIGFHESNHDGARQQQVRDTATPKTTLPSRHRGTGTRTAADVVASPDAPVLAPTSGRVIRAGSYVLYCNHTDNYAVIEPDARPGWEVKVLHFRGLRVRPGDRVSAGETVIGDAPRTLPFSSQVDEYSQDRNWPHLHVEVVDPSIPDRPGRGC